MIRVVIVDDDRIVRDYIRAVLAKHPDEFALVGEAANGAKGLALLRSERPDVAIVDVEMTAMSGIDLLHTAMNEGLAVKILMLSCHDEYEYVREALLSGGCDYLLKHKVDEEALIAALRKLSASIQETAGASEALSRAAGLDFPSREEDTASLERLLGCVGKTCVLCRAEMDGLARMRSSWSEEQMRVLDADTFGLISGRQAADSREFIPFRVDSGRYGFFIALDSAPTSQAALRHFLHQEASQALSAVWEKKQISFTVGVSEAQTGLSQAKQMWEHACSAVTLRVYMGVGKVIFYGEQILSPFVDDQLLRLPMMTIGDRTAGRMDNLAAMNELFDCLARSPVEPTQLDRLMKDVLALLHRKLGQMDLGIADVFPGEASALENLWLLGTLEERREFFRLLIENIYDAAEKRTQAGRNPEISKAVTYIEENYASNLTLEVVARHVSISKTYFSSVFKKGTGSNFCAYLQSCRLRHACEALCQTNDNIYNIAYNCGFRSHNHFNNIFKETYGRTPRAYRMGYRQSLKEQYRKPL